MLRERNYFLVALDRAYGPLLDALKKQYPMFTFTGQHMVLSPGKVRIGVEHTEDIYPPQQTDIVAFATGWVAGAASTDAGPATFYCQQCDKVVVDESPEFAASVSCPHCDYAKIIT